MSAISMSDMVQFIRARRTGHTPESMLQQRIEKHQKELAKRATQAAGRVLKQVDHDRATSESLNNMVEEARPTEQAKAQLTQLRQTHTQLESVRREMAKDLEQVISSLEDQERHKANAHIYLMQLKESLAKRKKSSREVACFYEVGTRVSSQVTQKLDPK